MISIFRQKTTLTTGLAISLILGGLFHSSPTTAQEIYIDNKCQPNPQLSQSDDKFTVFYKSEFKAQGKTYWFYSGRYQDGSAIFCLSQPGFKQARPLNNLKQIQFNFIDKITKDTRSKTAFFVVTHEGNGSYVPMNEYRLNFATPSKPAITKLRTWKSPD